MASWDAFGGAPAPAAPPPPPVQPIWPQSNPVGTETLQPTSAPAPGTGGWSAFGGAPDVASVTPPGGVTDAQRQASRIDPITGRPWASVGNIPANDVVGQATDKPILEDRVPGFATQAIASLPTDPDQKVRVVAGQLFPGLAPKDAQSRIFFGPNGRMAAVGMDGKPFYVEPAPGGTATDPYSPSSIASTLPTTNIGARAGSQVGPALPAVGGVGGGAIAGPTSPVVGPVLAAGGAAAGDALRQYLARSYDPDPSSTPYNFGQTASEAAGAGVGQFAGVGALRFFAPNTLASRLADPRLLRPTIPEAENVNTLAKGMGVDLTPGQLSGSPALLGAEDVIHSGSVNPINADAAQRFYQGQRNQLMDAFDQRVLSSISSAANKTDAAMQFQQGAEDATRIVRQQANTAAGPAYQAAQQGGQVMSPDLAQLSQLPGMQDALRAAATDYHNLTGRAANIDAPDFQLWNLAKTKLDDAVSQARMSGDNTTAGALDSIRSRLLTNLDAAYPSYATARATAAPGQRLASRLESSVGSAVGDGTERAGSIVNPVFNTNNPAAISEARNAFVQAGRQDEWNAGVRSYLQDAIDKASKSQDGLNPSMLRAQLWGSPDTRAAMQAAMTPQQFQGLDNFMSVLEASARSRGMNSATAPRQASAAELRSAAEQGGAGVVRAIGNLSDITQGLGFRPAMNYIADRMNARSLQGMTARLFSPDGMQFLQRMAAVSPMSLKAVTASSEFLGQQLSDRAVVPRIVH